MCRKNQRNSNRELKTTIERRPHGMFAETVTLARIAKANPAGNLSVWNLHPATSGAGCGLPIEKELDYDKVRPFLSSDKSKVIPGVLS